MTREQFEQATILGLMLALVGGTLGWPGIWIGVVAVCVGAMFVLPGKIQEMRNRPASTLLPCPPSLTGRRSDERVAGESRRSSWFTVMMGVYWAAAVAMALFWI